MLFVLTAPVILRGGWWASRPMVRETLILPDDSVPKEEDAKIVIKAYQKFRFAYYRKGGMGVGGTLNAGWRWIDIKDKDTIKLYESKGYKLGDRIDNYLLYYYPIPYVETLVVYVRSKEERCILKLASIMIRLVNKDGNESEGISWGYKKIIVKEPNKWERIYVYLPSMLGPNYSFNPIFGVSFTISPFGGAMDSCATFEVGPIYLK